LRGIGILVAILSDAEIKHEVLKVISKSKCTPEEFDESCERYARYLKLIQIQRSVSKVELPKKEKE
jgi:hypothetical protein